MFQRRGGGGGGNNKDQQGLSDKHTLKQWEDKQQTERGIHLPKLKEI